MISRFLPLLFFYLPLALFGQADIPPSSPINRTLGAWECDWENERLLLYNCKLRNNLLISKNYFLNMPPLSDCALTLNIPDRRHLTPSFSYATYISEFNIFLSKFFVYYPHPKVSLIFCLNGKILSLYDNSNPFSSYIFAGDPAEVSDNF